MQQCTSSIADPISLSDDYPSQIRLRTLVLPAIPVPDRAAALSQRWLLDIIILFSSSFLSPILSIIFLQHEDVQTQASFLSMLSSFPLLSFQLSIKQYLRGSTATFFLTLSFEQGYTTLSFGTFRMDLSSVLLSIPQPGSTSSDCWAPVAWCWTFLISGHSWPISTITNPSLGRSINLDRALQVCSAPRLARSTPNRPSETTQGRAGTVTTPHPCPLKGQSSGR